MVQHASIHGLRVIQVPVQVGQQLAAPIRADQAVIRVFRPEPEVAVRFQALHQEAAPLHLPIQPLREVASPAVAVAAAGASDLRVAAAVAAVEVIPAAVAAEDADDKSN